MGCPLLRLSGVIEVRENGTGSVQVTVVQGGGSEEAPTPRVPVVESFEGHMFRTGVSDRVPLGLESVLVFTLAPNRRRP